jgi:hypothetical protein
MRLSKPNGPEPAPAAEPAAAGSEISYRIERVAELFEALFLEQPELTVALLDGLMRRCCDPGKAIWLVVDSTTRRSGQPHSKAWRIL